MLGKYNWKQKRTLNIRMLSSIKTVIGEKTDLQV